VLMVGAFSLASNVTGTLTHSNAVTKLLHMHGAFAVWDGASAAPHAVEGMAMNPTQQLQQPRSRQQKQQQQQEQQQQQPPLQPLSSIADKQEVDNKNEDQEEVEEDEEELWGVGDAKLFEKDALFFSPHKFPGGPQAVGVLVVKKALLRMMNNNSVDGCRDASCASKHETTMQKSDQQRSQVWRWGINNNGGIPSSSSSSSSEQHQVKNGIGGGISSADAGVGAGVGDGGAVVDFKGRDQSSTAGGGTVFFVGPSSHVYARNDEEREQGGTLPIVGAIRAGLCMQLQTAVGASVIGAADAYIVEQVRLKWAHHPNLVLLGPSPRPSPSPSSRGGGGHGGGGGGGGGHGGGGGTNAPRVPVFALLVRVPTTRTTTTATSSTVTTSTTTTTAPPTPPLLFLHHNAVVAMLNDLFGVQCRGGCMCAGPYSQQLLGIDQKLSDDFMTELTKKEDNEVGGVWWWEGVTGGVLRVAILMLSFDVLFCVVTSFLHVLVHYP
jgi:selenocysteine lyase/cysteine desulfurase